MSNRVLTLSLVGLFTLATAVSRAQDVAGPEGSRCNNYSFAVEINNYYGDGDAVLAKVEKAKPDLSSRRVFAVCVEARGKAEVLFFERVPGTEQFKVSRWEGSVASARDLSEKIHKTVLDTQGRLCIGEQVKGLLVQACGAGLVDDGIVPAPASAAAVLRHLLKPLGGAYLAVQIIQLC